MKELYAKVLCVKESCVKELRARVQNARGFTTITVCRRGGKVMQLDPQREPLSNQALRNPSIEGLTRADFLKV